MKKTTPPSGGTGRRPTSSHLSLVRTDEGNINAADGTERPSSVACEEAGNEEEKMADSPSPDEHETDLLTYFEKALWRPLDIADASATLDRIGSLLQMPYNACLHKEYQKALSANLRLSLLPMRHPAERFRVLYNILLLTDILVGLHAACAEGGPWHGRESEWYRNQSAETRRRVRRMARAALSASSEMKRMKPPPTVRVQARLQALLGPLKALVTAENAKKENAISS